MTVRFIVEVSDGYIKERCDLENLEKLVESNQIDPIKMMLDYMSFRRIAMKVEEGVTEFTVSSEKVTDDRLRKGFNNLLSNVATLAVLTNFKPEEEDGKD